MTIENFWWQLKHNYFHHMFQPHLDLLVWILINNITPECITCAEVLEDTHWLGCSKQLTTYQQYFKRSWKALEEFLLVARSMLPMLQCGHAPVANRNTNGTVHAVPHPPIFFWHRVVC
jgi:hypothetical protein